MQKTCLMYKSNKKNGRWLYDCEVVACLRAETKKTIVRITKKFKANTNETNKLTRMSHTHSYKYVHTCMHTFTRKQKHMHKDIQEHALAHTDTFKDTKIHFITVSLRIDLVSLTNEILIKNKQ